MFILSLEVLRQRLVTDMTYIKQVDVGLLIVSFSAQLWFSSGLRAVVPGDQLALLPEGTALIEREEREDMQVDHLVSVSQDNCRK